MNVVAIIPARYNSSRLYGKPLVDICGKPMIWVYKRALDAQYFSNIFIATEDQIIVDACKKYGLNYFFNTQKCDNVVNRLWDVSNSIAADYYLCINGDEPIIEPELLVKGIPDHVIHNTPIMHGLMREFTSATEAVDPGNIKLAVSFNGKLIYSSRSPIPFPHTTVQYAFKKYIGVECYNKEALDFYVHAEMGPLEKIESIGTLRFLEYGYDVYYTLVESQSLSVDTTKDLQVVKSVIEEKGES